MTVMISVYPLTIPLAASHTSALTGSAIFATFSELLPFFLIQWHKCLNHF